MAYLKDEMVNWKKFQEDIKNLPKIDKKDVLKSFYKKWAPEVVSSYIIEEIVNS